MRHPPKFRYARPFTLLCVRITGKGRSMSRTQSTRRNTRRVAEHGYTVIYERLTEGGYQVIVPALPGIVTYGRSLEEARDMAQDAIRCHIRALLKDGEEIPEDPFA